MITNKDAVLELAKQYHSDTGIYISGNCQTDLLGVALTDNSTLSFTFSDVLAKKAELEAAEPMRQLRIKRNQLLQQSDWMAVADRTMTQAQIDYRQALRDLPATADPELDENGQLTGVNWPTAPTN